jgi:exosome complex RNA-binding protein Rrp4
MNDEITINGIVYVRKRQEASEEVKKIVAEAVRTIEGYTDKNDAMIVNSVAHALKARQDMTEASEPKKAE